MGKKWLAWLAAAVCTGAGCAETAPPEWPKECVGRLQLALPGEADQAAILGKEQFRDSVQYGQPVPRFPDGEKAHGVRFLANEMEISHSLMKEEKIDVEVELRKIKETANNSYKAGENLVIQDWPIGKQEGMGWIEPGRRITLNLFAGDVLFSWYRDAKNDTEFKSVEAAAQNIVDGLRPRPLFDVPHEAGLCLPYVFVPDSGQEKHSVAMTYRLREHPDITVNLRGRTAESTPTEESQRDWRDGRRPEVVTNEYRTDSYWDGRLGAGAGLRSFKTLWRFPSMRPMKLAGRAGLESFVVVIRADETEEDYIYHAVARGDPDRPEAAPDIQLVVEQNRQNAVKRGIKPLTRDEVLKLARQTAASVTVRPAR